ncbi:methyltransferase domain protein [mine drainage metagenome]|uniref:Methyltransferase domain protein n=1 Tax=mine drainage metagenome TaxID=410659 RepID=A0A1J5P0G7_9ZZZZ
MNIYSAQCLLPPAVVTTGPSDPQMRQIRDVLYGFPERTIKILDFGAGKGRLITNLLEAATSITSLSTNLDYIALDCDSENRIECEAQIARVYGDVKHRWFKTSQSLIERHNKGSFDVIVITNVLHEISPKYWLKLFGSTGELTELLADKGQLLLVEDQRIPIGETAHEFGFIVLDTVAIKDLFMISGNDEQIIQASERDGRLKAHLIPKSYLARCDKNSVQKALESHCQHSKSEIEMLRAQRDKNKARLFAFWVHQYANAKLALEAR